MTWNPNAENQLETIAFETIPSRQIPIPRNLPTGYKMITHPVWQTTEDELTSPHKIAAASFDEIDAIIRDIEIYQEKLGVLIESSIDRDDYWQYKEGIEAAWDDLDQVIVNVHRQIKKSINATYPQSVRDTKAPTFNAYLTNSIGADATQAFLVLTKALKINVDSQE